MKSRQGRLSETREITLTDCEKSERFVRRKIAGYLDRVLARYPGLDTEVLTFVHWLLEPALVEEIILHVAPKLGQEDRTKFDSEMEEGLADGYNFGQSLERYIKRSRNDPGGDLTVLIRKLLKKKAQDLRYSGTSELEKSLTLFRKMFRLNKLEVEICLLLFIISEWYATEAFFEDHLRCTYYSGRNYLSTMLGASSADITNAVNGGLSKTGMVELDGGSRLCLNSSIDGLFRKPAGADVTTSFFRRIRPITMPLSGHLVDPEATEHILNILRGKPSGPAHVLLYGPPGTGKTSYAHGLGRELKLPIYQVEHGGMDTAVQRLAAVTACLNMTRLGSGSLVIADDSDAILNTGGYRESEGEYADKKRLHDILEEPGSRMIWIVNEVEHIEESVLRRFFFSLRFRRFSRSQRVKLWTNIVRRHKCKRFFTSADITEFASRFQCNPGAIDHAVRNAGHTEAVTKARFHKAVSLALEAHESLMHGGRPVRDTNGVDSGFFLEGLNIAGAELQSFMKELESFDRHSKSLGGCDNVSMRLLFYGPPGTGKSRFARYIASHLDREITQKRGGDLLSKWVGETEKNIRDAFDEAASRGSILIFDEADSLIFNREQAAHSWEASMTNEFLARMEEFTGIQIFTTNRLIHMDAASMRRFNHKLQFRYLTPNGACTLYARMLAPLVERALSGSVEKELKRLRRLTPGDFKTVRDKYVFREPHEITHEALVAALKAEEKFKALHAGEKSIGFMA
ncbi:MAG: ATP-binding protein [Desulfomonilaceae bacterium]|nr:ATP-binding protein [Desulfomonilaceae bacterium]